jgi:hypothetical protein
MPVVVRELIIKAKVSGETKENGRNSGKQTVSPKHVEAGLEEVIKLIKNRNER